MDWLRILAWFKFESLFDLSFEEWTLREATNHENEVDGVAFLLPRLCHKFVNFLLDLVEKWPEEAYH